MPATGLAVIILGIGLVIANYVLPFLQYNWLLWVGFALVGIGFAFLMRYR